MARFNLIGHRFNRRKSRKKKGLNVYD